jgi:hypothetical protein
MKTALELLRDLWPIVLILVGVVVTLIISRDKDEKPKNKLKK